MTRDSGARGRWPALVREPRWIVAGLVVFLLVAAVIGDRGLLHVFWLRGEVADQQRDIQALTTEHERLSRAIGDLRDNPAVIERVAREELGLVRPGERVLRFPRSREGGRMDREP